MYILQESEDVSLLEGCPHFRGWYVQASMELGPEDVSLLERYSHFRGWLSVVRVSQGFKSQPVGPVHFDLSGRFAFLNYRCTTIHVGKYISAN